MTLYQAVKGHCPLLPRTSTLQLTYTQIQYNRTLWSTLNKQKYTSKYKNNLSLCVHLVFRWSVVDFATILTFLYLHFNCMAKHCNFYTEFTVLQVNASPPPSSCRCCCCWILSINSGKAEQGTGEGSARSKHQWYPTEVPAKCPYYSPKLALYTFAPRPYWGGWGSS